MNGCRLQNSTKFKRIVSTFLCYLSPLSFTVSSLLSHSPSCFVCPFHCLVSPHPFPDYSLLCLVMPLYFTVLSRLSLYLPCLDSPLRSLVVSFHCLASPFYSLSFPIRGLDLSLTLTVLLRLFHSMSRLSIFL